MEESTVNQSPNQQPVNVYVTKESNSNGLGTAGFVCALIAFFFSWVPGLGWTMWVLGTVFSFVGVFRVPKGLAIAGLVISFFGLISLIVLASFLAAALAF